MGPRSLRTRGLVQASGDRGVLADQVYEQLRSDILHARLLPGDLVSENGVAHQLGVSRTPVREAVQRLVREGLVQVLPQRGSYVALLSMQRIHEALFVREAVETQVVRRVAQTVVDPANWRLLDDFVSRQTQALAAGDLVAAMAADDAFHRALLDLCAMSGAWSVVVQARDMLRRVRAIAEPELQTGEQALEDHRGIVDALRRQDAELSAQRMAQHVRRNALLTRRIANLHPDYFEVDDRVNPAF